ncbi:MAG: hypothetical protein V7711_00540 [Pseudomonadales bacterium]
MKHIIFVTCFLTSFAAAQDFEAQRDLLAKNLAKRSDCQATLGDMQLPVPLLPSILDSSFLLSEGDTPDIDTYVMGLIPTDAEKQKGYFISCGAGTDSVPMAEWLLAQAK